MQRDSPHGLLGVIGTAVVLVAGVACGTDESGQAPAAGSSDPVVEVTGMVSLAAADADNGKRFVIRYPSDGATWNGRLVVAAHGGTGGPALAADGTQVGTSETSLDDVVGDYAIAHGFAYACVDRDGIGGTPQGLAVVTEFAGIARARVAEVFGRDPDQLYLVGLSMGGGIARLAAEDPVAPFDGIVIIAGALGDAARGLDRLARRAALWPQIDPKEHPELADDDPQVVAYAAEGAGTPVEARALWSFIGAGSSTGALRRSLERYGLDDLAEEELAAFSIARYAEQDGFLDRLRADDTTGSVVVPTIEVVGTFDDFVLAEILAYKKKVAAAPETAALHRLYQVRRAWHISREDNALDGFRYRMSQMGLGADVQQAAGEFGSYVPAVQRALDLIDRWVTEGVAAPPDQTVDDGDVPAAQVPSVS